MPSPLETDTRKGLSAHKSDRIAKIETFRVPPRWLFVRVETESGIVGWGEAILEVTPKQLNAHLKISESDLLDGKLPTLRISVGFFPPKHR
jgi:L-alanine-DL-glutamate epimerase-like enolase superfamily enzyme